MRAFIPAIVILLLALPAQAAPTCVDRQGDTIRCGTPRAMPVGWTPSAQESLERELSAPPGPDVAELLALVVGLAALFGVIALLPEFDGSRTADWDRQEGDDA